MEYTLWGPWYRVARLVTNLHTLRALSGASYWWTRRVSDPQRAGHKPAALPIELRAHRSWRDPNPGLSIFEGHLSTPDVACRARCQKPWQQY